MKKLNGMARLVGMAARLRFGQRLDGTARWLAAVGMGLGLAGGFSGAASAAEREVLKLAPPEAGDLVPRCVVGAKDGERLANTSKEPVSFSWALSDDKATLNRLAGTKETRGEHGSIDLRDRAPVMRSKEYWVETGGADLQVGIELETTAPGALVRVSPQPVAGGVPVALDPEAVEIIDESGAIYGHGNGMDLLVSAEQLRAADTPFSAGTMAFRLKEGIGAGRFILRAGKADAKARYGVHVLDRKSTLVLAIGADRMAYLDSDRLVVRVRVEDGKGTRRAATLTGFVRSPAGREEAIRLERTKDGAYRGTVALRADEAWSPGLWEAHVLAVGEARGVAFRRYGKTAFAVALPTARLDGRVTVERERSGRGPVAVQVGVEVGAAGRYEVRALLYGTDEKGRMRPGVAANTAGWLEAGQRVLTLSFDRKAMAAVGLKGPFELRDVRLLDQGRVALIGRQAHGATFR